MTANEQLLRFLRDNAALMVALIVIAVVGGGWIIMEAIRGQKRRDELEALKAKLAKRQADYLKLGEQFNDPVVLANRWLNTGAAATTSDGGCLLYVDRVDPDLGSAGLTVRVDGEAVHLNHSMTAGEFLQAQGKYGTYTLKLCKIAPRQVKIAVALRSRHKDD